MRRYYHFLLLLIFISLSTTSPNTHVTAQVDVSERIEQELQAEEREERQWADYSDRVIVFSGYQWRVKGREKGKRYKPGDNFYGSGEENVYVDEDGNLRLRIVYRDGQWEASEVTLVDALGHGRYEFRLASRVDRLDPNLVFGMFLWEYQSSYEDAWRRNVANEFNLEFGIWKDPMRKPGQYVCPPKSERSAHYFDLDLSKEVKSTHSYDWTPKRISCKSWYSHVAHPTQKQMITYWSYTGSEIPRGEPRIHISFWMNGEPPADGEEHEVVVKAFHFHPTEANRQPIEVEEGHQPW